jgi:acetylornithine/succinyldiaminopimelate/putrescine aminotransferase
VSSLANPLDAPRAPETDAAVQKRVAELAGALADGGFPWASKDEVLADSVRYWNPGKTGFWQDAGVPLVIDRREGYYLFDVTGARLIDVHLNGGTYNLGHRNPEVIHSLISALDRFDVGNHHFPSMARTALAEALVRTAPRGLADRAKVIYGSGGGEAVDIALKTARHATGRRRIVSVIKAYHGHTGLAVGTGDDRFSRMFLSDRPDEFTQVRFNDLEAMERALSPGDAAAVIMETIPATYGFPMPEPGYLAGVKALCEQHGTLYIADEVQTGLGRTGALWGISKHGVEPDLLVTGKGLSGGLYPIAAVLVDDRYAGWLTEDGFGHISTFGGAELGCVAALTALDVTIRPETTANVRALTARFAAGLASIQAENPDWLIDIRQDGLVIGLEFAHPAGAKFVMRHLYANGVWAIFSTLDPRVLQYKPGVLVSPELADEILERTATAVALAAAEVKTTA